MNSTKNMPLRWLLVCLIPALTLAAIHLSQPLNATQHLLGGIVLACEAVFLLKFILFEAVKHHLKNEPQQKRQTLWLLLPIAVLTLYLLHYFGLF